jgi:ABC-type polysaccharide/polyol phosphate export permease
MKLTLWTLVLNCVSEASELFHAERSLLLNSLVSEEILVFRLVWKNYVFYLHNLIVVSVFLLIKTPRVAYRVFFLIPYGLVASALLILPALLLARIGTRYRDLGVLIPSFMQLAFFASPILWVPPETGPGRLATDLNPLGWILETGFNLGSRGSFEFRYAFHIGLLLPLSILVFELLRARSTSVRNIL